MFHIKKIYVNKNFFVDEYVLFEHTYPNVTGALFAHVESVMFGSLAKRLEQYLTRAL